MESGDAGGLPMVRPGDASKYYFLLLFIAFVGLSSFVR